MGQAAQSTAPSSGAEAGGEATGAGSGTAGFTGGAAADADPAFSGGEGSLPSGFAGAAVGSEFSRLIPQEKLVLWLMADQGIGLSDGGRVAVWADQSINEADAWQSLVGLQPTVAASETVLPPMVGFDGVSHQLALPSGFSDFSAGLSVFIIARQREEVSCPSLLQLSNGPEMHDIEIGRDRGTIHYQVGNYEAWGVDNAFALNQRLLVGVVHAPEQAPELRLNGVFMGSGDFTELPPVTPRTNNFIGRSLYEGCQLFPGEIGEVIVYARAVDSVERDAIQRYLLTKWSFEPPVKSKPGPGDIPAAE